MVLNGPTLAKESQITGLSDALEYRPDSGRFYWKVSRGKSKAGKLAGCLDNKGYVIICYNHRAYKAHRLAWYLTHGHFPNGMLDHINRNKADNRINNLRLATGHVNSQNVVEPLPNTTTNYRGVCYIKRQGKYRARIMWDGVLFYLGTYETPEEAYAAYLLKKKELIENSPQH